MDEVVENLLVDETVSKIFFENRLTFLSLFSPVLILEELDEKSAPNAWLSL